MELEIHPCPFTKNSTSFQNSLAKHLGPPELESQLKIKKRYRILRILK